jgi:hypothetical protein
MAAEKRKKRGLTRTMASRAACILAVAAAATIGTDHVAAKPSFVAAAGPPAAAAAVATEAVGPTEAQPPEDAEDAEDAAELAKMLFGECNNLSGEFKRQAVWTVLNRADGTESWWGTDIQSCLAAKSQFCGYKADNPVTEENLRVALECLAEYALGGHPYDWLYFDNPKGHATLLFDTDWERLRARLADYGRQSGTEHRRDVRNDEAFIKEADRKDRRTEMVCGLL